MRPRASGRRAQAARSPAQVRGPASRAVRRARLRAPPTRRRSRWRRARAAHRPRRAAPARAETGKTIRRNVLTLVRPAVAPGRRASSCGCRRAASSTSYRRGSSSCRRTPTRSCGRPSVAARSRRALRVSATAVTCPSGIVPGQRRRRPRPVRRRPTRARPRSTSLTASGAVPPTLLTCRSERSASRSSAARSYAARRQAVLGEPVRQPLTSCSRSIDVHELLHEPKRLRGCVREVIVGHRVVATIDTGILLMPVSKCDRAGVGDTAVTVRRG